MEALLCAQWSPLYCASRDSLVSAGWCRQRGDYRIFKLSRLTGLELLDETFSDRGTPPPLETFDAAPATISLVVRFAPEVAFRVYDEFEPGQIVRQSDGSLLVCTQWAARRLRRKLFALLWSLCAGSLSPQHGITDETGCGKNFVPLSKSGHILSGF